MPEAARPPMLRRVFFLSFGLLFAGAMLVAVLGAAFLLPGFVTRAGATLFLTALVAADLAVLFFLGRVVLKRQLVGPIERMVTDLQHMSGGGSHRVGAMPNRELHAIRESVNALADRLAHEQSLLAENVASLERTNAELVEARDQVIRTARLASVGTLGAGIAHEVGNPLGAILGFVDVARSRALREGHDTALLESIRDEAIRIDRIVRGLLEYSRPREAGTVPVAVGPLLERVRGFLSAQGRLDAVEHVWRIDEELPPLPVDPGRLEQVMVNLLLNALDAVRDHEAPRIEVGASWERRPHGIPRRRDDDPATVDYRHRRRALADVRRGEVAPLFDDRPWVVLRIADNGPGIAQEDLERIFDPFFTTKPPGLGTGLGLSICARLVEDIGGQIEVANADGGGAIFTIRVPAAGGVTADFEQTPEGEGAVQ